MRQNGSSRTRLIRVLSASILAVATLNLVWIQIIDGANLAAEGEALRTQASEISPRRGAITDATGIVLAESVQTYHIAVNPKNIVNYVHRETYEDDEGKTHRRVVGRGPAEAARQLAPLLKMDEAELGGLMLADTTYQYLKKNVDAVTYREIRALNVQGIEWEPVFHRIYPNDATAAPLVGTINAEGVGSSGLEAAFNEILTGTPGTEAYEIEPNGAIMPGGKQEVVKAVDGATLRTTIRADLQQLIQEKLDARVAQHQAEWGSVVVLEASTGRILVMADSGSTAPNNAKLQPVAAVQYAFEPGSVGKVLTVAAALDKGTVNPTSTFNVPYSLSPADAGGPITDFHPHDVQTMTTTGILAESSNTGTVLIGETIDDQDRYDLMRRMGLGEITGVELPGESEGLIRTPEQWQGRDRYVTMFGQAYMLTALQEASLMSTIGNGGIRVPPRIVDSWTMPDSTVHTLDAAQPVEAMRPETATQLVHMMESAVESEVGTGQAAQVEGYRIALKTGTADIVVDGNEEVVSTAAGLVPADAPRLAIAVVLYNPKVGVVSSESAAPLFGEVVTQAARNLAIPASSEEAELYPMTP